MWPAGCSAHAATESAAAGRPLAGAPLRGRGAAGQGQGTIVTAAEARHRPEFPRVKTRRIRPSGAGRRTTRIMSTAQTSSIPGRPRVRRRGPRRSGADPAAAGHGRLCAPLPDRHGTLSRWAATKPGTGTPPCGQSRGAGRGRSAATDAQRARRPGPQRRPNRAHPGGNCTVVDEQRRFVDTNAIV